MKYASLYLNEKQLAKKLGVSEDDIAIRTVTGNYGEIEIEVIMSDNAEPNIETTKDPMLHTRRQKLL